MPFRVNFSDYAKGIPTYGPVDAGYGLRALAEQNLKQQQMAEQTRQFNTSSEQRQKEHSDKVLQQKQTAHDINTRFASQQANQIETARVKQSKDKHASIQKDLDDARALVVGGKWNEALALVGSLKDKGADVSVETGPDGRPVFNLKGSPYSGPEVEGDFNSILGQVTGESQPQSQQHDANALNPLDTHMGTLSSTVNPEPVNDPPPGAATADGSDTGYRPPPAPAQQNPAQNQTEGVSTPQTNDPRRLDTAQLQNWTNMRLDPVLSGIEAAIPGQYQSQANSLLQGFKSLGQTPEGTLKSLQDPLNTAAGLWKSEIGAQGQMARAGISQGGQASSEDRLREVQAGKDTDRLAIKYGLPEQIQNVNSFDTIRAQLNSGSPQAQASGIKQLIGLTDGKRITDKDFDIGFKGIASNVTQARIWAERLVNDGLTKDQLVQFNQWLDLMKIQSRTKITAAQKQIKQFAGTYRYEPERLAVKRYIIGNVPSDMLDPELQDWDPTQQQGGLQTRGGAGKKKSVSVTAPTTQQAVEGTSELDEFLE